MEVFERQIEHLQFVQRLDVRWDNGWYDWYFNGIMIKSYRSPDPIMREFRILCYLVHKRIREYWDEVRCRTLVLRELTNKVINPRLPPVVVDPFVIFWDESDRNHVPVADKIGNEQDGHWYI